MYLDVRACNSAVHAQHLGFGTLSDDFSLKNSQKKCRGKKDTQARCKKATMLEILNVLSW
jgi:hypothetical protein